MVEKEECQEKKERNLETKCTTVDVEKCQQVAVWSCFFVWVLFKMPLKVDEEKCEQVEVEKCEEVEEEKCEVVEEMQCKVEEKERCEEVVEEVCNQVRTWLCLSAIQMMEVICMATNI